MRTSLFGLAAALVLPLSAMANMDGGTLAAPSHHDSHAQLMGAADAGSTAVAPAADSTAGSVAKPAEGGKKAKPKAKALAAPKTAPQHK